MSKISIVGVEGSGKTVMMAAFGDKYKHPDSSGLFLSPENPTAFIMTILHGFGKDKTKK